MVGSGILLELLIGLAVGYDTRAYQIVGFVLDTTMVLCGLTWAVHRGNCGDLGSRNLRRNPS